MSGSLQRSIILELLKNNICKFCILRFLNEKNSDFYLKAEDRISKLLNENISANSPDVKKIKSNPCSACLGLLQNSNDPEFINRVVREVKANNFDSDNVTFALFLPISLQLRNRSLWLYISNKFLDFFLQKSDSQDLKQESSVVTVKEVWKWLTAQNIAEKLEKSVSSGVNGTFHVNISYNYEEEESEICALFKMFPKEFQYKSDHKEKFYRKLFTQKNVKNMLSEANLSIFEGNYPVPPSIPLSFLKCHSIKCYHDPIFIAGRYNKLSRNISQTVWMVQGERKMEKSVEEIIAASISKVISNSGIKFSSSGREDVDVRTLGRGRPFVLTINNPKLTKTNNEMLRELEKDINNSTEDIYVRDLQIVPKEDLYHIKEGEESKSKTYNSYCFLKLNSPDEIAEFKKKLKELSEIKDLAIQQKTPIRVLHRRSLIVRPKTIYWLEAQFHEVIGDKLFFKLRLKVGAGTYIKEFVHGDFGRTTPNLGEILERETDILALDVEEVNLNWPPFLDYDDTNEK